MKRLLVVVFALLLIIAIALVLALILFPSSFERIWSQLGLPAETYQRFEALLPDQLRRYVLEDVTTSETVEEISASGTLEAEVTRVMSEISGQVASVAAGTGDMVIAAQPLVRLDTSLLDAQLLEAQRAIATARANLEAARAGPREEEIALAEADLRQAQATWHGARQAVRDAEQLLATPQDLEAQIHAAQARVRLAERQIEQARAQQAAIAVLRQSVAGDGSDQGKTMHAVYEKQEAAAAESMAAAEAEANGARRALSQLLQMRENPVELKANLNAARNALRLAKGETVVARAALALAAADPRPVAIALPEAQLAQAEAAYALLLNQADKHELTSPISGVVTTRGIEPGETALPGTALLTIADLSQLTLRVFVPENQLGLVRVGQEAEIRVDAYPAQPFPGTVFYIAPEAEFAPRDLQTEAERVTTVFAVEIRVHNPDRMLKPGMPADATIPVG